MDDVSASDEVCATDLAEVVEAYTPKTAVQRGDRIYGHCVAQAVMDIIDDDGESPGTRTPARHVVASTQLLSCLPSRLSPQMTIPRRWKRCTGSSPS